MSVDRNEVVAALSEEHVAKITGLSIAQLRAWDKRGFFRPKHAYASKNAVQSRIYSFKDAVGLQAIATLKKNYRIGFSKLEEVANRLKEKGFSHWADTKLYVVNREVHFKEPGSSEVESLKDGQLAMLAVIDVIDEVRAKVIELKSRSADSRGSVERHRFVSRNSWVVAGTRIPTATIRRYRDAGFSVPEIIEEYPSLTEEDIFAALEHEKGLEKSA